MKKDLRKTIRELFEVAYLEEVVDADYQDSFASEGSRKARYIIDDLRYREARGRHRICKLGYLSIGGADGSEAEQVLRDTEISKAVMIEISDSAVRRAVERVKQLAALGKELIVLHGDATAILDTGLRTLEGWCSTGDISGLVCSAQGVLHELPRRSPGFDLPIFLGKLFRSADWQTCAFYSREPCSPVGWPELVRIRIPGIEGAEIVRAAQYVRDRLKMSGSPVNLAGNWVGLPATLAVETLHKLIRGSSVRRIGYELGEQLTEFDPMAVKRHLESFLVGMRVSVEYVVTSGFKMALDDYEVEYVGHNSECLPIPRTHSEIVGFRSLLPEVVVPEPYQERSLEIGTGPISESVVVAFSNPFHGDIPDAMIKKWLGQFEHDEQPLIAKLLNKFTYVDSERGRTLSRKLHGQVQIHLGAAAAYAWFVPLGGVAKSGSLVSCFYRIENGIPMKRFLDYSGLAKSDLENGAVVLLDDFLATGHQAALEWKNLTKIAKIPASCRVLLATLVSCEAGESYIEERTDIKVLGALRLTHADEPLESTCDLFRSEEEMAQARNILRKYGEKLAPKNPFGHSGSGLLLGFAETTPVNSLPIFWSRTANWIPLLEPRGSS